MPDQPRPRRAGSGSLAAYEFHLFGRFAGRRLADGADVTPRGRKTRALLAYLLLEHKPVERERLAALLWSERGQAQAHASLRQCLLELRDFSHSPDPLLSVDRHQVATAGSVDLDLDRMNAFAERGEAEALAAALERGDAMLEDLDGIDPAFDEWLRAVRTSRGEALVGAAQRACRGAIASGREEEALKLARQLQRIDPLDEAAARLTMEAAHALGRSGSVHQAYEALRTRLREDLGVDPAEETRALHRKLAAPAMPAAAPDARHAGPAQDSAGPAAVGAGQRGAGKRNRRLIGAAAAAMLLLAAAAAMWRWQSPSGIPTVAVAALEGQAAGMLARDLSSDLARLASARPDALSILDPDDGAGADYLVRVGSERLGDTLRADFRLLARGNSELLWSARFERPAREIADLRQQMSAKLGSVLICAGEARAAERLDRATERLFLAACEQADDPASEQRLALLRQVTDRAPAFALALAMQAGVEAELARNSTYTIGRTQVPRAGELRNLARIHLQRARELDPSLGETYGAEAVLIVEQPRWGDRIATIGRGIAVDPDNALLYEALAIHLAEAGRLNDAVASARRAAELDPISGASRGNLVLALAHSGNIRAARRELEGAERVWPNSTRMRETRYAFNLRYGDPANALRMLDAADARGVSQGVAQRVEWERAFLRARMDPSPAAIEEALRPVLTGLSTRTRVASFYLQALGAFGRIDELYNYIESRNALTMDPGTTATLFRPFMRGAWRDRRFMPLMERIGLLRYWQESGEWPDLCLDPELTYDCRAEARRLLARRA